MQLLQGIAHLCISTNIVKRSLRTVISTVAAHKNNAFLFFLRNFAYFILHLLQMLVHRGNHHLATFLFAHSLAQEAYALAHIFKAIGCYINLNLQVHIALRLNHLRLDKIRYQYQIRVQRHNCLRALAIYSAAHTLRPRYNIGYPRVIHQT